MVVEITLPEVNALLPQNGVKAAVVKGEDMEKNTTESEEFDPFRERTANNRTTDCQTLTHLWKSTLGSGIMSMPYAFKASGIVGGILGGLFIAAISTHASYTLVNCAHILYVRMRKTQMEYADVVESAFATGPMWGRKYAKFARQFILVWLFSTYFGACVADNLLISTNYGQVIRYYNNYKSLIAENATDADNNTGRLNTTTAAILAQEPVEYSLLRTIMACLLVPLILFVWVPNLKYLAPISTLANCFMAIVIGITCYYLVLDPLPISEIALFQPITQMPQFFSITLFAMANVGVILPLENNMKTPQNFLGICGILNRGMFSLTSIYLLLGVLGYMKYGDKVNPIITANLPVTNIAGQVVKILIGSTVLLTFSLQFYVCREMVWTRIGRYFPYKPLLVEYITRALLVTACVSIAIALPMISPMVSLVGAFGFSFLGIITPVIIELLVYWDIGYGRFKWRIFKNAFFIILGVYFLVFGTTSAVNEIITEYSK